MKILEQVPVNSRFSTETLAKDSRFTPAIGSPAPLIYAVDDLPCLTELYTLVLEAAGCVVRAFHDRADVLAALKADGAKPDLLITDYLNVSMPFDRFMRDCRAMHPALRVLMVSGFDQTVARNCEVRPDRFLRKPFTHRDLRREVRAALAGDNFQTGRRALESCGAC